MLFGIQRLGKVFAAAVVCFGLMANWSPAYATVTVIPQPGTSAAHLKIVQKVVDSFNRITEQRYGVTLTKEVKLFICPNRDSYRSVLKSEFGMSAAMAERYLRISGAVANEEKDVVAINLDPGDTYDTEYHAYYSTAHELAHQLQFQLAGNKLKHNVYWLLEGTAEWISAQVVEGLGYQTVKTWKTDQFFSIRQAESYVSPAKLSALTTGEWNNLTEEYKYPYPISALMVCYLAAQTGERMNQALMEYFKLSTGKVNDGEVFQKCFGIELKDFSAKAGEWIRRSTARLGNLEIESNGNLDQYVTVYEGFYRSQSFFQEHYQAFIRAKQQVTLAPERHTYITTLMKEFRLARTKAERVAAVYPGWNNGHKIVLNLGALPDCETQVYQTALATVRQFQNQQLQERLMDNLIWLKQGIAPVLAAYISEQAEVGSIPQYREVWTKSAGSAPGLTLTGLRTEDDWNKALEKFGPAAVNSYAALAVLSLIESKAGPQSLEIWLASTERVKDPLAAFVQAYSKTPEEFSEAFQVQK